MNFKNILLVGAGQLGSRHLQGLARCGTNLRIEVVDHAKESLETAEKRFAEVAGSGSGHIVNFNLTFEAVEPANFELVIIATNSDVRDKVVDRILDLYKIKYLILEKVAYQSENVYRDQMEKIRKFGVRAWINCPRRIYSFYESLREQLSDEPKIFILVEGGKWGLGCNSIHFLDLFGYLSGGDGFRLSFSSLDDIITESKRKGFIEFSGILGIKGSRGTLVLIDNSNTDMPAQVTITAGRRRFTINEQSGEVEKRDLDNGGVETQSGLKFPFQSDLTGIVAKNLLEKGECGLTPMEESFLYHSIILNTLTEHLSKVRGLRTELCPIT